MESDEKRLIGASRRAMNLLTKRGAWGPAPLDPETPRVVTFSSGPFEITGKQGGGAGGTRFEVLHEGKLCLEGLARINWLTEDSSFEISVAEMKEDESASLAEIYDVQIPDGRRIDDQKNILHEIAENQKVEMELKQFALDMVHTSQPAFLLLVLGDAKEGQEDTFVSWFKGTFRDQLLKFPAVLRAPVYERDSIDVTWGRFPPVPRKYLALVSIAGKGIEDAHAVIDFVQESHAKEGSAIDVATWLYYPASVKYGLDRGNIPTTMMVHFTNPVPGLEDEYGEWFNTRLLRHAAVFDPLVSGQRFERSLYQKPGALTPEFQTVALYDQAGSSERLIEAFKNPPPDLLDMVSLDNERFTESAYLPLI